jgi:hypothetical protein
MPANRTRPWSSDDAGFAAVGPAAVVYTYNNRINRLSTIQEHYMLRRAIDRGVSKERLARAFNLDISSIDKRINLLEGVGPEIKLCTKKDEPRFAHTHTVTMVAHCTDALQHLKYNEGYR